MGKNNQDLYPGESLETIFCSKLLKFFAADCGSGIFLPPDPGWKKSDPTTCTDTCALPASTTLYRICLLALLTDEARGVTKRCRLSWLTNSALVYEPQCGGIRGVAGSRPRSTVVHRSPNKL
jgi:hypothetical protein